MDTNFDTDDNEVLVRYSNFLKDDNGVLERYSNSTRTKHEVTIPDSFIEIGGMTFYGNDSITKVTIPNSVTAIGDEAFQHCDSLSDDIKQKILSINAKAFG